jgi:hypothetical protein
MLTAIAALLITSLVGGVFGSVATYTYMDSSKGKYCDKMSDDVESDEEFYSEYENQNQQQDNESDNTFSEEADENEEY